MNKIVQVKFFGGWQSPAITEKQAWLNHLTYVNHVDCVAKPSAGFTYIAFPWASAIDYLAKRYGPVTDYGPGSLLYDLIVSLFKFYGQPNTFKEETHTVCQHIHWPRFIPVWEKLGIRHVHCSHLTKGGKRMSEKLTFHPWPLYAVNAENALRHTELSFKPWEEKKYLCSFVGCVENSYYRSSIRNQLRDLLTQSDRQDVFFSENELWFFWPEVFGNPTPKESYSKAAYYNQTLSDSVFSLCPEGSGPNTLRLWESLAVGSIPVLFENDWVAPPLSGLQWSDISVTVRNRDIPQLFSLLDAITPQQRSVMQLNGLAAYRQFRNYLCVSP